MITIELPQELFDTIWDEYCKIDFGMSGFKGFRYYIEHKIPNALVKGNVKDGFTLTFESEKYLTWFLLKWS